MPEGRLGKVTPKIFEENHGLRQAWFGAWYPKVKKEKKKKEKNEIFIQEIFFFSQMMNFAL